MVVTKLEGRIVDVDIDFNSTINNGVDVASMRVVVEVTTPEPGLVSVNYSPYNIGLAGEIHRRLELTRIPGRVNSIREELSAIQPGEKYADRRTEIECLLSSTEKVLPSMTPAPIKVKVRIDGNYDPKKSEYRGVGAVGFI